MIFSTGSPGLPAQSKLAEPLLLPSTMPFWAHRSPLPKGTPSFWARPWISHGSQTLRKSMNSGGLPPESQVVKSIVSRPCVSASVANGSTVFLPLWSNVELKRLSITSAIGKGMPRRSLPHSS